MKRKSSGASIQNATLLYILSLLASVVLAVASAWYRKQMHLQNQAVAQQLRTVVNHYLAVDMERRLLRDNYADVFALHERGVLGPERRLDWMEGLQLAGKRLVLPNLHYHIGPQAEYKPAVRIESGAYRIYYSPMEIAVDVRHEEELRLFLASLVQPALGLPHLVSCRLSRLGQETRGDSAQGRVRAECELRWFNIRKQDGGEIDLS